MFGFMENTKIGTRILIALFLPVIGLILFSGYSVIEKQQTASEMGLGCVKTWVFLPSAQHLNRNGYADESMLRQREDS